MVSARWSTTALAVNDDDDDDGDIISQLKANMLRKDQEVTALKETVVKIKEDSETLALDHATAVKAILKLEHNKKAKEAVVLNKIKDLRQELNNKDGEIMSLHITNASQE